MFIDGLSSESINRRSNSVLEGRIRETISKGIDDFTSIITIGTTRLVGVLFILLYLREAYGIRSHIHISVEEVVDVISGIDGVNKTTI